MKEKAWNKCDYCGKFIPYDDFQNGATRDMILPDSDYSVETFENICKSCNEKREMEKNLELLSDKTLKNMKDCLEKDSKIIW